MIFECHASLKYIAGAQVGHFAQAALLTSMGRHACTARIDENQNVQ